MRFPIGPLLIALFFAAGSIASAAKLDVECRDLNGQDVRSFGGLVSEGALVEKSTGNALAAGIRDEDVIIAVDGMQIQGIYDLENALSSLRSRNFDIAVHRVKRDGLLRLDRYTFTVQNPIDLQIRKAFELDMAYDSPLRVGEYHGQKVLMWFANRVWVYEKQSEKEHYASLVKVYNILEHKTYRYPVAESVIWADFLTDDGLVLYVSTGHERASVSVFDMQAGDRDINWSYEIPPITEHSSYGIERREINGDSIPEIFICMEDKLYCIDGATGNLIWFKDSLGKYLSNQRSKNDSRYSEIYVQDFTRDGSSEVLVGPLLLNAATGEKKTYLSFDPVIYEGGVLECRQVTGDPMPDLITRNGLYDGNSNEKVWEPLRSSEFFLSDLDGDGTSEIVYLLSDGKLHIHETLNHKELYSVHVEGVSNLSVCDLNADGFIDIIVRKGETAYIYQTNIPQEKDARLSGRDSIAYCAPLLDYGLKKDKFFLFARDIFQKGLYEECIPLFLRALADNPGREEAIRYLASAYMKTRRYDGALELLKQKEGVLAMDILNRFSSEIVAYLLDKDETWKAIDFLKANQNRDPILLSRCYLAVGRPEEAIQLLTQMEQKPTEAQFLLGKAYVLAQQFIPARIAFKNYTRFLPTDSEGWYELGELESHEKNWVEAEEDFGKCLELDPLSGSLALSAFYLRAHPLRNAGKGLSFARDAYGLQKSARTRLQLVAALIAVGEYEEASVVMKEVENPGIYVRKYEELKLALSYHTEAEVQFRKAENLLLNPVFRNRNFALGRDLLEEVVNLYPESLSAVAAHYRLGELYLHADHKDPEKAIYHFDKVALSDHPLAEEARRQIDRLKVEQMKEAAGAPISEPLEVKLKVRKDAAVPSSSPDGASQPAGGRSDPYEMERSGTLRVVTPVEKSQRPSLFRRALNGVKHVGEGLKKAGRTGLEKSGAVKAGQRIKEAVGLGSGGAGEGEVGTPPPLKPSVAAPAVGDEKAKAGGQVLEDSGRGSMKSNRGVSPTTKGGRDAGSSMERDSLPTDKGEGKGKRGGSEDEFEDSPIMYLNSPDSAAVIKEDVFRTSVVLYPLSEF
ncbi:MAG: tetratricopeptide repeat protein [Planctomycetes bacterium]|nr:tetratricopeptide repeat protein [Planctomycetota bacterium]